jgi:hypothetical protein
MSTEETAPTSIESETSTETQTANADANQTLDAAPEEGTTESTQEQPSPTAQTEEDKRFAAKFAALSRREKAVKERERQIEKRLKDLEERTAVKPEPKVEEEPLKLRALKKPFETLKELGLDYETLTKIALNEGQLTPEIQMQILREELDNKYRAELDQIKKQLSDKEQKEASDRDTQTIGGFKREIGETIRAKAADFELLSVEGEDGIEMVFSAINNHYEETGEVIEINEAAEAVENQLLNEAKKRIELNKIKKLMGASQVTQPPAKEVKKPSVTLSNQQSQVQPSGKPNMSDEESKREAAKLIKWINE